MGGMGIDTAGREWKASTYASRTGSTRWGIYDDVESPAKLGKAISTKKYN